MFKREAPGIRSLSLFLYLYFASPCLTGFRVCLKSSCDGKKCFCLGRSEPEGALWGALALEDAGSGFEPTTAEGIVRWEDGQGLGVEGAECCGGGEGKGVEGPVALGEEWGQKHVARREGGGLRVGFAAAEVDQRRALGLELMDGAGEGDGLFGGATG